MKIYKPVGLYVTMGMPVALIGNFDKLYFKTSLSDSISYNISVNQMLEIKFPADENFSKAYGAKYERGNHGENEVFNVRIFDISPPMNEPASMHQIIFEIDNRSGLLEPGLYNDITIIGKMPKKCLAAPMDDKMPSLFVVEDGILKRKRVTIGIDDGTYIEILSGLSSGEMVVTSETEGLQEGTAVEVLLEGD